MKNYFIIVVFLLLRMTSSCQVTNDSETQAFLDHLKKIKENNIGKKMKPFEAKLLNGNFFSEKQLEGKITLISFWFASCRPCLEEMPEFNLVFNRFKENKKFQQLGITFESFDEANRIKDKFHLTYPILLTTNEECSELSLKAGYPVTVITDCAGRMIYISLGGRINEKEIKEQFELEIIPKIEEALQ